MIEPFSSELVPDADPVTDGEKAPSKRPRRVWVLGIKAVVTAAVLWWVVTQIEWAPFWRTAAETNLWIIALVLGLQFVGLPISAFRWQQLLAIHGVRYSLGILQVWYLVALFLSQFLPTLVGGDAYRIYKTYRNPRGPAVSVLAVFAERVTGLITMLIMGFAAAIFVYLRSADPLAEALVWVGSVGIAIGLPVTVYMLYSSHLSRFAESRFCPKPVRSLLTYARDYRAHSRLLLIAWIFSFLFHGTRILATWLTLYALGVTSDVAELTVAVVAVSVIGSLPISLGGLGVMEGSFVFVMARYGVSTEASLITMLLMRALQFPMCALGGLAFMLERKQDAEAK